MATDLRPLRPRVRDLPSRRHRQQQKRETIVIRSWDGTYIRKQWKYRR